MGGGRDKARARAEGDGHVRAARACVQAEDKAETEAEDEAGAHL